MIKSPMGGPLKAKHWENRVEGSNDELWNMGEGKRTLVNLGENKA